MVSAGSFVTVRVTGEVRGTIGNLGIPLVPGDIKSGVADLLEASGLHVVAFTLAGPDIVSALVTGQWLHYSYDGSIVVQTAGAYDAASDVGAIVNNAIWQVTGILPTTSTATVSQRPPTAPAVTNWWDSLTGSVTTIGNALQIDAQIVLVGLILILIALVVFVGPTAVKAFKA
jgi:hypothetical protein